MLDDALMEELIKVLEVLQKYQPNEKKRKKSVRNRLASLVINE